MKGFRIKRAAHMLHDFQQDVKNNHWDETSVRCWACGEKIQTFYHKERLYSVRCPHCLIERSSGDNRPAMLVKAGNPEKAAAVYIERDKLAFETKNNSNEAVLADILRYATERYESGIADFIACQGYIPAGHCENPHEYGSFEYTEFCRACKLEWLEREFEPE